MTPLKFLLYLISYFIFFSLFLIVIGTGILCIYKQSRVNWHYQQKTTNFVIPYYPDHYAQTQSISDCDSIVGVHYLASSVSGQSTINHVNTDVKNIDDSQSFETPSKNNHSFTYLFLHIIQLPQQILSMMVSASINIINLKYQIYHTFLHLERNIFVFK